MGSATTAAPVVCLGESMAMFVPVDDGLDRAATFIRTVGGAESNVASYLARLDVPVRWVSRVGDDAHGRFVVRAVAAEGVDVTGVEFDGSHPTGVFFKDPQPAASRVAYYRAGSAATRMSAELVPVVLAGRPRLVHLSGITAALSASCKQLLEELFRTVSDSTLTSFDVNLRPVLWRGRSLAELRGFAASADIVLVGADEAQAVWGTTDVERLYDVAGRPRALVLKDGARGAALAAVDGVEFAPSLQVEVREPTGAGDAFAAGFLAGTLCDAPARQCLRLGHLLAACALSVTGDVGPVPPLGELRAMAALPEADWSRLIVRDGRFVRRGSAA